jgi:hypothetical protein
MKYLIALSLMIASFNVSFGQEVYVYPSVPVVPVPVVQTVVYQPQSYTVLVPVVVRPQPVVSQQVVYYPVVAYVSPTVYPHWTHRCRYWGSYRY